MILEPIVIELANFVLIFERRKLKPLEANDATIILGTHAVSASVVAVFRVQASRRPDQQQCYDNQEQFRCHVGLHEPLPINNFGSKLKFIQSFNIDSFFVYYIDY